MKMRPIDLPKSKQRPTVPDAGGQNVLPIRAPSPDSRTEQLMPYEKVAKAIYVRANGLPAYRKVTGQHRHLGEDAEEEVK